MCTSNGKHNIKHKASSFALMSADERKEAIVKLSGNLQKSNSLFRKQTTEAAKVTRANYEVSRLLAHQMKLFTDQDFIKECIMVVIDSLCPESVSLSPRTVCCCIEMSDSMNSSLKTCCSNCDAFSFALDESTDMKDTAQLVLSISQVTAALQVYEKFLQPLPLHGTATGQDMLQCVKQYFLDLSRLVYVTTDGAPAMTGEKKDAASLPLHHYEAARHTQPIHKVHCIIHHEFLCSKVCQSY